MTNSSENKILANTLAYVGFYNSSIQFSASHSNELKLNQVTGNEFKSGVELYKSHSNQIISNTCNNNTGGGIKINESDVNLVERNEVNGGERGIQLFGKNNLLTCNRIENCALGIIVATGTEDCQITKNTIQNNITGVLAYDNFRPLKNITIEKNDISQNTEYGIFFNLGASTANIKIQENQIINNGNATSLGGGIFFPENNYYNWGVTINQNNIHGNLPFNINHHVTLPKLHAPNNYFGTTDESSILSGFSEIDLDYLPILTSPVDFEACFIP